MAVQTENRDEVDNFQGNYRLPKLGLLEQKFRKTHFCRKQKEIKKLPPQKGIRLQWNTIQP